MRKLIALAMACMLLGGVCLAAEWPEGRSPAQPYSGKPEVDLTQTMGYIILYPRAKMPAAAFCDVLEMYLPREDLERGEGFVHLYETIEGEDEPVEIAAIDCSDPNSADIRPLTEDELEGLMWGGGMCVEFYLPKSLEFGAAQHDYFVLMDEGCFTAADGTLKSLAISNPEAWVPVIEGDYGVSGLRYIDRAPVAEPEAAEEPEESEVTYIEMGDAEALEAEAEEVEDEAEETEAPEETPEPEPEEDGDALPGSEYVMVADEGDIIQFDLVMGGDAAYAVLYSDDGSVVFDVMEFTESASVTGTVVKDSANWGVVFLPETGEGEIAVLNMVR